MFRLDGATFNVQVVNSLYNFSPLVFCLGGGGQQPPMTQGLLIHEVYKLLEAHRILHVSRQRVKAVYAS
jgi:hypothetical protein